MSIAEFNAAARPLEMETPPPPVEKSAKQAEFRWGEAEGSARLELDWSGPQVRMSLVARNCQLIENEIQQEMFVAKQPLAATGPWVEICREANEYAQLIELEQPLTQSFTLQRQFVTLPGEDVLFLADALLGPEQAGGVPAPLQHAVSFTLGSGVAFAAAEKTYEGVLTKRRPLAQVFPLALPEWRRGANVGELAAEGQQLRLRTNGVGCRLYAPLLIDLRPKRFRQPFTWRKLTVAENLQPMPDEVAVGYRVQMGPLQILIYRSLGARGNRTLLGHNLCAEFLLARFSRKGEVESWMEIE